MEASSPSQVPSAVTWLWPQTPHDPQDPRDLQHLQDGAAADGGGLPPLAAREACCSPAARRPRLEINDTMGRGGAVAVSAAMSAAVIRVKMRRGAE